MRTRSTIQEELSMEQKHVFPVTRASVLFQVLMMLAGIYWAMLLTNWGSTTYEEKSSVSYFESNDTSFWCQLVAMWLT